MSNELRAEPLEQNATRSPLSASSASSGTTSPRLHAQAAQAGVADTGSGLNAVTSATATTARRANIPPNMSFFADAVVSAMPSDWLDWFTGDAGGAAVVELFAAEVRAAALRRRAGHSAAPIDGSNAGANYQHGHGSMHGQQTDVRRDYERESIAATISSAMAHRGGGGDHGGSNGYSSGDMQMPRRVEPPSVGGYYPPAHAPAQPQTNMYPPPQSQSFNEREYYGGGGGGDGRMQYSQRDARRPSGPNRVCRVSHMLLLSMTLRSDSSRCLIHAAYDIVFIFASWRFCCMCALSRCRPLRSVTRRWTPHSVFRRGSYSLAISARGSPRRTCTCTLGSLAKSKGKDERVN
jgi:hypothetical protein